MRRAAGWSGETSSTSLQMLTASSGWFKARYCLAFSSASSRLLAPSLLSDKVVINPSLLPLGFGHLGQLRGRLPPILRAPHLAEQPADRVVVIVDHTLLDRDDGVVGDRDLLGAHLGAAL